MSAPYTPPEPTQRTHSKPKANDGAPTRTRTAAQIHSDIDRLAASWNIPAVAKSILDQREAIEQIKVKIYRVEADRKLDIDFAEQNLRRYEANQGAGGSAGAPLKHLLNRELRRQEAARQRAAEAAAKARRESVDMLQRQLVKLDLELKSNHLGGVAFPPGA